MMKKLQTVTGPVDIDSLGLILPHEHLFTDLRGPLVAMPRLNQRQWCRCWNPIWLKHLQQGNCFGGMLDGGSGKEPGNITRAKIEKSPQSL